MTDNRIEKIRAEIERRYKYNKEYENGWAGTSHYWQRKEDEEILSFIDYMQKEPVCSVWHDKNEEPCEDRQVLICLLGNYYVDFFHKEDKRFYMFGNPKHYLCEVDKWAYIDDLINLSNFQRTVKNQKEPVSVEQVKKSLISKHDDKTCKENGDSLTQEPVNEELEEAGKEWLKPQLDKSYANYGEAKMMELTHFDGYAMLDAIEFGANWKEQQMMKKAFSAEIGKQRPDYKCVLNGNFFKYDTGDKVKVLIIKED